MTSRPAATEIENAGFIQLPDPPIPEDMNNFKYLHAPGNTHFLVEHLGNPDTTIVTGEAYISPEPTSESLGLLAPDLLIAFNVDPTAGSNRNGYVISEQGKPPDFVLEIGSASTGRRDATVKRDGYAALGILEYWRFDPSGGRYHGAAIAGDRLVGGVYQPIPIETIDEGTYQGHSEVLNLDLRWEQGQLGWYDPATGRHIIRFDDVQADRDEERAGRIQAETERDEALARIRELEEELHRRQNS